MGTIIFVVRPEPGERDPALEAVVVQVIVDELAADVAVYPDDREREDSP